MPPRSTRFILDSTVLRDPDDVRDREWLETNGNGAYAMSTPILSNTRKYHALLAVQPDELDDPHVLLSHYDIEVEIDGRVHRLSTNQYPAVLHPRGYELAYRFSLDLYPSFAFDLDGLLFTIDLLMPFGRDEVVLRLSAKGDMPASGATVRLTPFLAFRRHHGLADENSAADLSVTSDGGRHIVKPYGALPALAFASSPEAVFTATPDWYRCFVYPRERERGYDYEEDLMTPGFMTVPVTTKARAFVAASAESRGVSDLRALFDAEVERRSGERRRIAAFAKERVKPRRRSVFTMIAEQSRHFLLTTRRKATPSIVAGYPWFGSWGRDAMISLEGITLDLGRYEEAFDVLETFARFERDGLFPNQLAINGTASYNTIDASLWFFHAVSRYLAVTGDSIRVRERLLPVMTRILEAYFAGRVPDAAIVDGLLSAGSSGTQLTWMDAQVNGVPVTPRYGFPVEIQALWHHALVVYREIGPATPMLSARVASTIADIERRFVDLFLVDGKYLADVVHPDGGRDESVRPNQILAVSLEPSLLDDATARSLLDVVEQHLLTPFGLRTLAPGSRGYRDVYQGSQEDRDRSYHQGTVWPWLLAPFCDALLRYYSDSPKRIARVESTLRPLFDEHPFACGIASVSEVFDAGAPHRPGGCPMQAWSVAAVVHAWLALRSANA
jgi:predicted glycogen debranching enzyme